MASFPEQRPRAIWLAVRARLARTAVALALVALGPARRGPSAAAPAERSIILATTTSTYDSGLLDDLVPLFRAQTGIRVKVIAVGTGAALRMAARGDADVALTHAPAAERKLVESGDLIEGRRIMHNDFVLVGPAADPARLQGLPLEKALRRLAARGSFVSRGDDSGTHKLELSLWRAAGLDPARVAREETGQGMGATLRVADQRRAYTLSDRGTYLALRHTLDLVPLVEGDPRLLNIYRAYVVSPLRHPGVHAAAARAFVSFLVAPPTQARIGAFRRSEFGRSLFVPDAVAAGSTAGSS